VLHQKWASLGIFLALIALVLVVRRLPLDRGSAPSETA
jgi:hypothetical protein